MHLPTLWGNHIETWRKFSIDMFLTISRLCSAHSKLCNLSGEPAFSPSFGRCAGQWTLLPSIGRFVIFPERPRLKARSTHTAAYQIATATGGVSYTVGGATAPPTFSFAPPTLCSAPPTFVRFDRFRASKRTFSIAGSQSYWIRRHFGT